MLIFLASLQSFAANYWDTLDVYQRSHLMGGNELVIEGQNPEIWDLTYHKLLIVNANSNTINGAAIFWDLPGQASYLAPYGLVSIQIQNQTKSVKSIRARSYVQTPQGPVQFEYPQINTVQKQGSTFTLSWVGTNPNEPIFPGILGYNGEANFERPGIPARYLFTYKNTAFPNANLQNNLFVKQGLIAQLVAVARAHVSRFQQGASQNQIRELRESIAD